MNILGHPYIAFKVTGRLNQYLIAGSLLPDLVPFVPDSVFSFGEIHEGGDQLLKFLDKNCPQARDLALGMMSHSVKYGADKFNRTIEKWLLTDKKSLRSELAKDIAACSGVSLEVADKARMHNYLWAGVDIFLLRNEKQFIKLLDAIHQEINREEIVILLSEGFKKEKKDVGRMIDYFLYPVKPKLLTSLTGLVKTWKKTMAGLPEKDQVNEKQTVRLFGKVYSLFENDWPWILSRVVAETRKNMKSFI